MTVSVPNHPTQRPARPYHNINPNYGSYKYIPNASGPQRSQNMTRSPQAGVQHFPRHSAHPNQSCPGCGKSCISRNKCPAFGRSCHHCLKLNHFSSVCRSVQRQQQFWPVREHSPAHRRVNPIEVSMMTTLHTNMVEVSFDNATTLGLVDSGPSISVLGEAFVRQLKLGNHVQLSNLISIVGVRVPNTMLEGKLI